MKGMDTLRGQLVDDETLVTLEELCHCCAVQAEEIILLVREGIIDPRNAESDPQCASDWHFHISSMRRVRIAVHLQRDLGVNLPGAALALDLLDQIAELKRS